MLTSLYPSPAPNAPEDTPSTNKKVLFMISHIFGLLENSKTNESSNGNGLGGTTGPEATDSGQSQHAVHVWRVAVSVYSHTLHHLRHGNS